MTNRDNNPGMSQSILQKHIQSRIGIGNPSDLEHFLDTATREASLSEEDAVIAIREYEALGRYSDVLRIALKNISLMKHSPVMPLIVHAIVMTGNVDLLLKLGYFDFVLSNPEICLPLVGHSLIRGAWQLLERGEDRPVVLKFIQFTAQNFKFVDQAPLGPTITGLHMKAFDSLKTSSLITQTTELQETQKPRWTMSALARYQNSYLPDAVAQMDSAPRADMFPEDFALLNLGSGDFRETFAIESRQDAQSQSMDMPRLTLDALTSGFLAARDTAGEIFSRADGPLGAYHRTLDDHGITLPTPTLVLSTGRAGTLSLFRLLRGKRGYAPFHFMNHVPESGDINRLFFFYLTGRTSKVFLEKDVRRFLEFRMQEILWCAVNGYQPVFVNHFDLIFAPFYLALFPDMRIVNARRDPARTLISHAYKRQFRYRQIRPLFAQTDEDSLLFEFAHPRGISLEQSVTWFQYATELSAKALEGLARPGHFIDLSMDGLFALDAEHLQHLAEMFPGQMMDKEALGAHFSVKVNAKEHIHLPAELQDIARAQCLYEENRAILVAEGRYST